MSAEPIAAAPVVQVSEPLGERSTALYLNHLDSVYRRADRMFAALMAFQWLGGIVAALVVSPRTWTGAMSSVHIHVWEATLVGGVIASLPIYMALKRPGEFQTRMVVSCSQMMFSALLIHLAGGRIETHFHVFGSLAFLSIYRDWRVFIPATAVVGVDHLIRGIFWPQSVFGVLTASPWRTLEHAAWVLFEEIFLIIACLDSRREMQQIADTRAGLEDMNQTFEVKVGERTSMLEASEKRFRVLLESAPDACVILNELRRIIYINGRGERLFGYERNELLDKPLMLLQPAAEGEATLEDFIVNTNWADGVASMEMAALTQDGARTPVEVRMAPLQSEEGMLLSLAIRDVTERKKAEQLMLRAKEDAEAAERAKSEFLASMSHEIRTPLNGVIGMTGLMLDTELDESQMEYTSTIRTCADSLLSVINDILDFSKIEAGKIEFENINFDLRNTIDELIDIVSQRAGQKGLELVCHVHPEVNGYFRGDPGRLRQVLVNLANNAIKFTEEGEISVYARRVGSTPTHSTIRFEVTDTGIGIPKERLDRLFKSFSQVDASTTRRYGGTGLGLAISKRLVEMMGGEIDVLSEEGRGSTFWFTVVLEKQEQVEFEIPRLPNGFKDSRALIVDDNRANRLLCRTLLESWGCRCDEAEDAVLALRKLRAAFEAGDPYTIGLLDFHMPGMDGLELGKTIKSDNSLKSIELLLLTSLARRGDAEVVEKIGFAGYLNKPLKQSVLHECMAAAVGQSVTADPEALKRRRGVLTAHNLPTTKRKGRVLLAEDNIVNQKVALKVLEKLGYRAEAVANGLEAVKAVEMAPYDLVLMDCQMPEMDGYEATRRIRGLRGWVSSIPIIAMTANAMKGDRELCLAAGMDDYIAKPVDLIKLKELLAVWFDEKELNAKMDEKLREMPTVDANRIKEMFEDDTEMIQELSICYLNDAGEKLAMLEESVKTEDREAFKAAAHALKGASGNMGAERMRELAFRLEQMAKNGMDGVPDTIRAMKMELEEIRTYFSAKV